MHTLQSFAWGPHCHWRHARAAHAPVAGAHPMQPTSLHTLATAGEQGELEPGQHNKRQQAAGAAATAGAGLRLAPALVRLLCWSSARDWKVPISVHQAVTQVVLQASAVQTNASTPQNWSDFGPQKKWQARKREPRWPSLAPLNQTASTRALFSVLATPIGCARIQAVLTGHSPRLQALHFRSAHGCACCRPS